MVCTMIIKISCQIFNFSSSDSKPLSIKGFKESGIKALIHYFPKKIFPGKNFYSLRKTAARKFRQDKGSFINFDKYEKFYQEICHRHAGTHGLWGGCLSASRFLYNHFVCKCRFVETNHDSKPYQ